MGSKYFRVGVLGAGDVAETAHVPVLCQMQGIEVGWICDLDGSRASRLARGWGVRESFDRLASCPDVDALLVAIPVGRRRDALATAFERGWHALVEKPFASSLDEHLRILAEAASARVELGVGLTRRFFRSMSIARNVINAGIAGPVREVWASDGARMGTTGREGSWYQTDATAAGGGVLMESGVHLVDQVFFLLGVEAFHDLRAGFHSVEGIDLEARVTATLTRGGDSPAIPMRLVVTRMRDCNSAIFIRCEHATIRVGLAADATVDLLDADDRQVCRLERPGGATNLYQAFLHEWQAFRQQCAERAASLVDAGSALLTTRFIETAYRYAAARGR
jgi:predicted dehydrogenase